MKSCRLH